MSDSTNDINWVQPQINYIPDHDDELPPGMEEYVRNRQPPRCGNADRVLEYLDALSRGEKDSTKSENE